MVHRTEKSEEQNQLVQLDEGEVASSAAPRPLLYKRCIFNRVLIKGLIFILAAALTCPTYGSYLAYVAEEKDGYTWVFLPSSDRHTASVGCAYTDYSKNGTVSPRPAGHLRIPSTLNYNGIEFEVTGLWKYAFSGYSELTSVSIPSSVTKIGDYAFSGCSGLTSVTIPDSVTSIGMDAFRNCSGLISVTIPDSVTSIGGSAFSGCSSLTSITIPDSVTSIGGSVFSDCSSLQRIVVPSSIKSIPTDCFDNCSNLSEVTLAEGIESINSDAFANCRSLQRIVLPSSIKTLNGNSGRVRVAGDHYSSGGPFINCISLEEVTLNDGLESIGGSSFNRCLKLKHIVIPATVTNIADSAFTGCSGMKSVVVPQYVLNRGISVMFPSSSNSIEKIDYSSTITKIPQRAFADCSRLDAVAIPNSVTNIAVYAFSGCTGLRSVTISDGLTCIDAYAFEGCSSLVSVTIPNSVMRIGVYAFRSCNRLLNIRFNGMPPEIKKSWSVGGVTSAIGGDGIIGAGVGTYPVEYKTAWEAVIDENGYWHGIKMKMEGAPDSYKVMFDKNGGDSVSVESLTRDDGAAIGELPTATREGYDFDGWFTASAGGTKVSGSTVVTGDVTYYAHWTLRKPNTYTIIYNITEGEGSVDSQTCEFGDEVYVDDGGTLHWEGHCFMGWAFAPDGDVAYRVGDTVTEPTNGDSVTLYAKWLPEMTLEPMLADWSKGSITLLLGNAAELRGKKYSIWCRRGGDSNAQWWEITGDGYISTEWLDGEKLEIKDAAFYARYDAIQPVEYRVIDEYGRKAECMTRVKYAIAVGVDKYDPSMGCEDLPGMEAYAETFTNLAIRAGAMGEQVIALVGRRANLDNLDTMFKNIHDNAKPGDVCLLYFGTHGGHDESTGYNLALYKERYSVNHAFEHISSLGENVAVVGFVHACGSGGFTIGDEWKPNVAWITSTDSPHDFTFGLHFSKFLLDYGWQGGWAGTSDKPLTFGLLADYMGKSYDKFFSGLVMDGNMGEIKAKICNKDLLGKIGAGVCASHSGDAPASFTVNASKNNPDAVVLDGFSIPKSTAIGVFRRFAGHEKFSLSLGGSELVLFDKNHENIAEIVADHDPKAGQHSSPSNPMEFIVKAYNGAGVTTAALVQGWRAAMSAQTEDGRTWNYGKVDGGVSIVSAVESSSSAYDDVLKGDVVIPSTLAGMSVVSINAYAFEGCEEITSVTIPDSVTSIGDGAFFGCGGLTSVTIPNSVTSIGDYAFDECGNLEEVVFEGGMDSIEMNVFAAFEETPWLESYLASLPRPENDDFAEAVALAGALGETTGTNFGATIDNGEYSCAYGDGENVGEVWWKWTAPQSGTVYFDTHGSNYDTSIVVYTGGAVENLECIAADDDYYDDYTSRVEFETVSGTTYYIAVGGYGVGAIVLSWSMEEREPIFDIQDGIFTLIPDFWKG